MRLARILSYIFHPVFMPLVGVFLIFSSGIYVADIPFEFKRFVYALVLLCTVILPMALLPTLYIFRFVSSLSFSQRQDRILPLIFTTLCYYLGYYLLSRYSPVKPVNVYLFASVLVVLVSLLISLFWKISLHMAGIGGLLALIFVLAIGYTTDMLAFLIIGILVAGTLGTARLALQDHSIGQVLAGFATGFLIVAASFYQYLT